MEQNAESVRATQVADAFTLWQTTRARLVAAEAEYAAAKRRLRAATDAWLEADRALRALGDAQTT